MMQHAASHSPHPASWPSWSQVGLVAQAHRPSPWTIFALLALFLIPVSMIPSTWGGFFHFPLLPNVWWTTNLLVVFAAVVVLFRAIGFYSFAMERATILAVLGPTLALGLWQTVSLMWDGRDNFMRGYSLCQSLTMCSAAVAAVVLVSGLSRRSGLRLARTITALVVCIAGVYVSLSFLVPGWRPSESWMDRTTESLGFVRVFGPLGTSTTLNFIFVPALGVAVGAIFVRGWPRFFWMAAAFFLLIAIFSTGSRGGMACLAAYSVALLGSMRLRALLFLLPMGALLGIAVLILGVPERFRNLEDASRFETYTTAMRAYTDQPESIVLGVGHGGLYSKLHDDSLRKMYGKSRWFLLQERTRYGYTLRNSHSVFVRSLAETGPLGLVLAVAPLLWLMYRLLALRYYRPLDRLNLAGRSALAASVGVIPYMALEEFFISAHWPTLLWWIFAVLAAEGVRREGPGIVE